MTTKPEPRRRRGTPITAGFAADLQTLGTLLGNHTRGLDAYLQRQASRVEERYQGILANAEGFLLSPDLNFDAMTASELKDVCRSRHLRGWSNLRRDELLAFVKQQLASEIEISHILQRQQVDEATHDAPHEVTPERVAELQADPGPGFPHDASRTERLLLLLLRHLDVPLDQLQEAWQDRNRASQSY
ncbi:MAG: hypothetical protein ACK5N0_06080 [Synechococcaceae cyanobacterium]